MNVDVSVYPQSSAQARQAWLFDFMRALDGSELSERERKACWTWAERWSLCASAQESSPPRYPYEWVLRQTRQPAGRACCR